MLNKKCLVCKNMFTTYPSIIKRGAGKYCSIRCRVKVTNQIEENHPRWKGNEVGYVSLHKWVRKHKGTPNHCELCGTTKKRRYEWAKISGDYVRNLINWFSLCVPCHRKYDDVGNKVWIVRRANAFK